MSCNSLNTFYKSIAKVHSKNVGFYISSRAASSRTAPLKQAQQVNKQPMTEEKRIWLQLRSAMSKQNEQPAAKKHWQRLLALPGNITFIFKHQSKFDFYKNM